MSYYKFRKARKEDFGEVISKGGRPSGELTEVRLNYDMAQAALPLLRNIRENRKNYGTEVLAAAEQLQDALENVRPGAQYPRGGTQAFLSRREERLLRKLSEGAAIAKDEKLSPSGAKPPVTEGRKIETVSELKPEWLVRGQSRPLVRISRKYGGHQVLTVLVPAGLAALAAYYLMREEA